MTHTAGEENWREAGGGGGGGAYTAGDISVNPLQIIASQSGAKRLVSQDQDLVILVSHDPGCGDPGESGSRI